MHKPSLMMRITIGKGIGFLIGLLGVIIMPYLVAEVGWMVRIGLLLWYTTLGAIIGMAGVFTWHPVLKLPMPWWFRAPLLGAWMNFVLTFFAYDLMYGFLGEMFGQESMLSSPFWFTVEGAVVGFIIGYVATRFGGEGKETVGH